MRIKNISLDQDDGEVMAAWGDAKLVKHWDGKLELRGGSKEDHADAREWMSLFWHEAVVAVREVGCASQRGISIP